MKVYIAAPLAAGPGAKALHHNLSAAGFEVTSKWYDDVGPEKEDPEWRAGVLKENMADLDSAHAVVAYMPQGVTPRCTLIEIGWALAKDKPVVWYGQRNVADAHEKVTLVNNTEDIPATLMCIGVKADSGKPEFRLVPPRSHLEVAKVVTVGGKKYGPENWRNVEPHRYLDAAYRHLSAYHRGEKLDADDGLHHLAHLVCCAMFLMEPELES